MASILRNIIVVGGSYVGKVNPLSCHFIYSVVVTYSCHHQTTAQELARVAPETHRVWVYSDLGNI